jgi:hypothetical protein
MLLWAQPNELHRRLHGISVLDDSSQRMKCARVDPMRASWELDRFQEHNKWTAMCDHQQASGGTHIAERNGLTRGLVLIWHGVSGHTISRGRSTTTIDLSCIWHALPHNSSNRRVPHEEERVPCVPRSAYAQCSRRRRLHAYMHWLRRLDQFRVFSERWCS